MRIGIPRALLYYRYFPFWESFFEGLNVELFVSPPTTEKTIRDGSKLLPGDLCLPVKIFFGHIESIKHKVDLLFLPRYISVEPDAYMCPKLMGLPDMVRATMDSLPPLIDDPIHCKTQGMEAEKRFYLKIGKAFSRSIREIEEAYQRAWMRQQRFRHLFQKGFSFEEALNVSRSGDPLPNQKNGRRLSLGVIGRPYYFHDPFLKGTMVKAIEERGIQLLTSEFWSDQAIERGVKNLRKRIYWSFGKEMVGSAVRFAEEASVQGMILLASFGCGQDSFNLEMIQHLIKEKIPLLHFVFDEHISQGCFSTRVEAFLEMIIRQKERR